MLLAPFALVLLESRARGTLAGPNGVALLLAVCAPQLEPVLGLEGGAAGVSVTNLLALLAWVLPGA